jgi:4-aminobutyrate aminotransferase/(S)-3-amino-2-methylpropionate transaminase
MNNNELWNMRLNEVPLALGNNTRVAVKSAKNATLVDMDDKEYIDFAGGIGCMNIGHNHPKVIQAIETQIKQFIQPCFHLMIHKPYLELAKRLNNLTPGNFTKQTMLCNSGTEAIENAVKVARFSTKKSAVISFNGAFHGRTYLSMSLTSNYRRDFGSPMPDVYHMDYPSEDMLLETFVQNWKRLVPEENTACVIIEPELGSGGFLPASKEIMNYIRTVCDKKGIIFIADEIQTGFYRTGKCFAMEHFGFSPDILVMGKSLASGMPLSALSIRKTLLTDMTPGTLGGTNSGNPVTCAVALASLDIYEEEDFERKVAVLYRKVRNFFVREKQKYSFIGKITGLGAMIGVHFVDSNNQSSPELLKSFRSICLQNGLLILASGKYKNILRTLMPLTITDRELEKALEIMNQSFSSLQNSL